MTAKVLIRQPGTICFAHGRHPYEICPQYPKCDSEPKSVEFMTEAGLTEDDIQEVLSLECYCVCHSKFSSNCFCDHCKGDNPVAIYHRKLQDLREEVLREARQFFGSIDRTDTKPLLEATGNLLLHEHHLTN